MMLGAILYSIDINVSGFFSVAFCPKLKFTLRYAGLSALNLLAKLCCGVGTGTKVTMFRGVTSAPLPLIGLIGIRILRPVKGGRFINHGST